MNHCKAMFKGSANYIWDLNDCLGQGSVGQVYVGRHRHTGNKYAVKVFRPELKMMRTDYAGSEIKILKDFPTHVNIVKIIAIEIQKHSTDNVVIMELCEGGSLQHILNEPRNYFGLPEEEFLLVLFHIGAALDHLHINNIIHRDVKPGNILLFICPDDSHVYKLTDFGTSKCLIEGGSESWSITGTEEYLHPDVHRDAFILGKKNGCYGFEVDLWSFGVTVYQCATGQFPFQPLSGIKQDKRTLQKLIRERDREVISQIEKPDGYTSRASLPDKCNLTSGTKEKTVYFLTQLLNIAPHAMTGNFFDALRNVKRQLKLYVFVTNTASMITLYLGSKQILCQLKQEITKWTGTAEDDQLLFWDVKPLLYFIEEKTPISQYPETTADKPILLIANSTSTGKLGSEAKWQCLSDLQMLLSNADGASDSQWAKQVCGTVHFIQENIKEVLSYQEHLFHAVKLIRYNLDELSERAKCAHYVPILNLETCDVCVKLSDARNDLQKCKMYFDGHATCSDSTEFLNCFKSNCAKKVEKQVRNAETLYHLIKDQRWDGSHNQVEIQKYNKSELRRICRHLKSQMDSHCIKQIKCLLEMFLKSLLPHVPALFTLEEEIEHHVKEAVKMMTVCPENEGCSHISINEKIVGVRQMTRKAKVMKVEMLGVTRFLETL